MNQEALSLTSSCAVGQILERTATGWACGEDDAGSIDSVSLNGTSLEISQRGALRTVELSSLQDGTTDADADPTNEYIISASLSGTTLRIVDGGGTRAVDLSAVGRLPAGAPTRSVTDAMNAASTDFNRRGVVVGTDGLPFLCANNGGDMQVAHCDDAMCTTSTVTTLTSYTNGTCRVTVGVDGYPVVVRSGGEIRITHCERDRDRAPPKR